MSSDYRDVLAGFLADSLFLTLLKWFGPYTFLIFAAIALAGGIFSFAYVPETKGRTLAEVQALITGHGSAAYLPESSADPAPQGLASELSSQALPRDPTSGVHRIPFGFLKILLETRIFKTCRRLELHCQS